ncbi:protein-disulfide reductase DsbD family protein [Terriglobus tenax]|uniref:protein-disulfide reductase DsbD family protein n=1 Tax=Terriglobus tenax TaxID=1111115 RepID=UPI0021DFCC2C|nr:thioredoxin family protein [Terriglobus tenax]
MKWLSRFLVLWAVVCASGYAQIEPVGDGKTPGPLKAQHLTVELVAQRPYVYPNGEFNAGLVFTLEEGWHVYWLNAGDSGESPHAKWTLPAGITATDLKFPVPGRLPLGPLMDFGYEEGVTFPFTFKTADKLKPGKAHVEAKVDWLVCAQVCLPGKAILGMDLNVLPAKPADEKQEEPVGAIGSALKSLPVPLPQGSKVTVNATPAELIVTLHTPDKGEVWQFYPFDQEQIKNAAEQRVEEFPGGVRLHLAKAEELTKNPAELHGLIKLDDGWGYEFRAPVSTAVAEAIPVEGAAGGSTNATLLGFLGLAFVGGVVLNLMPCVFPVLFLKALALVQSAGEERKRLRAHGLAYTAGIVASFWAIVAVLLLLRAGGSQLGWGFQLQSPGFVAVLAGFLFFFGLSLAGMFELGLSLTSVGGGLAQKQGMTGSFFTGVLATVVATPCTAPLMGAAIGFALAQPAWVTFSIFTAVALGLAAPYMVLSLQPAWTKILPKPGMWMETLKQFTSVFLFFTVIWLVWVFGRLFGEDAMDRSARLLVALLLIAIAGWALKRWQGKWIGVAIAVLLIVGGLAIPLTGQKAAEEEKARWAPWSEAAVQQAHAEGKAVFVDYTAAWCLSCQVNERVALNSDEVQARFKKGNVVLLKADWTKYDPAITAALRAVGRSGVPTYVIYPAGGSAKPDVLPELLSKSIVIDALDKDLK